jgi:hypothetical protein
MSDTYNPLNGGLFTHKLSQSITQKGKDMLVSIQGGKPRIRNRTRNKRYRYSKYAYLYKKHHKPKSHRRK